MTVLMGTLLVVVLATFQRYGFTTDDRHGFSRAQRILAFIESGGSDSAQVAKFGHGNFYGAMPDIIALVVQKALPALSFDSRHLVSALFGVVGIFYAYLLGCRCGDLWTGPIAAILLTFNPMWFGSMFINIKDIPFATALLAASHHGLGVFSDERQPGWCTWLGLTIWSGLLAGTKLLGLPMLGVVVFIMVVAVLVERRRFDPRLLAVRAAGAGVSVLVGSMLGAALFWPQLFLYTSSQILKVLGTFLNYTPWKGTVLLDGVIYPYHSVPRHYSLTYLVVSLPLFVQALFLSAIPVALRRGRLQMLGFVAVPAAFLLVQLMLNSRQYGGYRHFLFIVPFMTIAAAGPLAALAGGSHARWIKLAGAGALTAFMAGSALDMLRLFPYQYSSYNVLVGGTEGAQGRFYIDVWESAHREALAVLDGVIAPGSVAKVFSCGPEMNNTGYTRLKPVEELAGADYVVALRRHCPVSDFPGYRTVAEVKRGNVLFAAVLAPR